MVLTFCQHSLVMSLFTEKQLQLANSMLKPATLEQLAELHQMPAELVQKELDRLVELQVAEKQGNQYVLKPNIASEIERKRTISVQDPYKLRISAVIEVQAVEETLLKKGLGRLTQRIKDNSSLTIYTLKHAEMKKSGEDNFSSFIEIEFSVKDFESLIKFVYFYGPTVLEVIKPDKVEIEAHDLQDALMFMADLNYRYAELVSQSMSKKQIEEFYNSIYK